MHSTFVILGNTHSSYGAIVMIGMATATIAGILISYFRKLDVTAFLKLELSSGIAAVIGAKLWDMASMILLGKRALIWDIFENSGYSFYGGLLFGAATTFIGMKVLKVDVKKYTRYLICLIPLLHAVWKIGCFMGGCCYGIEYSGPCAVMFPDGVDAPAGVLLFPAQLAEAGILFVMAAVFFVRSLRKFEYPILNYLICYSAARFALEFVRFRESKISVAQVVSLFLCTCAVSGYFLLRRRKRLSDMKISGI